MPCTNFKCPDGVSTPIKDCLAGCRMGSRCASLPYLRRAGQSREWTGKPSITQLENGPRLEYLKITTDYTVDPREDMAFAILGTASHDKLADLDEGQITEERLHNDITHGQFDNYTIENGRGILTDYKTYGSYAVKKILDGDNKKETRQLNGYRMLLEKEGFKVNELWLDIIVRDGGTFMAKKYGVIHRFYHLPIAFMDDAELVAWQISRGLELVTALDNKQMPRLCNAEEAWDGKRCADYCSVKDFCVKHGDNTWIK